MFEEPRVKRFLKLLPVTIAIAVVLGLTDAGALVVYGAMFLLAILYLILLDREERNPSTK